MSTGKRPSSIAERINRIIDLCSPEDYKEVKDEVREELESEDPSELPKRRGGQIGGQSSRMTNGEEGRDSEGVTKSKEWAETIENRVEDNTQTVRENRKILATVDERTSILMRLVFAILVSLIIAIGAGVMVQFIMG